MCSCSPIIGIKFDLSNSHCFLFERGDSQNTCSLFLKNAALFPKARTWKEPIYPLTADCVKKMWYMHTMEYHSAMKRNKTGSFVEMWVDLGFVNPKWSQKEKNKYCVSTHGCGIKRNSTDEPICRAGIDTDVESRYVDTGKGKRGVGWTGRWDLHIYTTTCKTESYGSLLCGTRNSVQGSVVTRGVRWGRVLGGRSKREGLHIHTPPNTHTHV